MDATRIDAIARLFAARRLSRRQALAGGGAGLAAGALAATTRAQEATPGPAAGAGAKTAFLFVQSFQSGSFAPKDGAEDAYTLTLEQGLGQTVYFSDRPERIVGATPTADFLKGMPFGPDNPPNAALVFEATPGDTDVVVLELTEPTYDEATKTATYDATVLADFEKLGIAFQEAPKGAGALHPSFGAASLFIDDCPNDFIRCTRLNDLTVPVVFDNQPFCWNYSVCMPCEPGGNVKGDRCQTYQYWNQQCNAKRTCEGDCRSNVTTAGAICDP